MKRLLLAVLAIVLTLGLAACSSSTKGGSDKVKEISFWHVWGDKDARPIKELVKKYNESQDKVHVKFLGNQDPQKQLTAISGGNAPDIAYTYWNNVGPWASAGAVQSLNEMIESDKFDINMLIPAATKRMEVGGEQYALPFTMSMASKLFYNKKSFEKAGLTEPPETMEELMEYAKKLTIKDGNDISQIGFIPDYPWIDNVFWPVVFGGSFYDESTGEVTPNKEENVRSIEYQQKFYEEFGIKEIEKLRSGLGAYETPQDPLITGKLAMTIGWENNYNQHRGEDGPVGVAPFPYPADRPDLKGSGMVSPTALYIPKNSKNQEEAWDFMKFLLNKDNQVDFAIASGTIPVLLEAVDDPRLTENEDVKTMWEFYEAAKSENLHGFPNSVYINEYLQSLTEETEKALKGEITAQEAMDTVKEKIQPLADKENEKNK
ncbi:ABC transporter substrate-binding protein [Lederbergia ruris]|uniref:ABC transporter substrate-binding protein n=1 Tax=Lederbergia ruris TaxID=217495 RepID=UPI0039A3B87A